MFFFIFDYSESNLSIRREIRETPCNREIRGCSRVSRSPEIPERSPPRDSVSLAIERLGERLPRVERFGAARDPVAREQTRENQARTAGFF